MSKIKRLYRSRKEEMVAGVLAGIADYLKVDPTIVRLIFVLLLIISFGTALIAYLIAWIIIPLEPKKKK